VVCVEFKPEEMKFSFKYELESVKKIMSTDAEGNVKEVEEEITEMKIKKVTLKTYGKSDQEDCEHFFEAMEKLKKELRTVWEEASKAKDRDAQILFDALDQMLIGTASSQWHNILATETKRDWETFKVLVASTLQPKFSRKMLTTDKLLICRSGRNLTVCQLRTGGCICK
jgi:hypothetical protein